MADSKVYFGFEVNGETVEFEVEGTYTRFYAAKLSGPPEDCYEAEGGDLDGVTVSRVHAHKCKDGKGYYITTEPCPEVNLYELIAQEQELTIAKAAEYVAEKLGENIEEDEPDYSEPDDNYDNPADDYIYEGY